MRPTDVISPFPWPLIPMCQFIALFRLSRYADHSLVCLILCPSLYRRSRLCQLSPSPHCRERATFHRIASNWVNTRETIVCSVSPPIPNGSRLRIAQFRIDTSEFPLILRFYERNCATLDRDTLRYNYYVKADDNRSVEIAQFRGYWRLSPLIYEGF